MSGPTYPSAMLARSRLIDLERARRRRDQAAHGSPDWDAASEAVLELESDDPESFAAHRARRLHVVRDS